MTGDAPGRVPTGVDAADVRIETRGRLGLITLDRPAALNALTHGMVGRIRMALDAWAVEEAVTTVAIRGAGDRAFCAGGDIVSLYRDATTGDGRAAAAFWRDEYRLNALIARYPKPYVALMDGIVLGGGIGLSAHGSHRIVTERSMLGMPETGIGFLPDVGGTWLLAHAPGELGTHLALTAGRARAADAIALGLADTFVLSDALPALLDALETRSADEAIDLVAHDPGQSELEAQRPWIDEAYAGDDLITMLERLAERGQQGEQGAQDAGCAIAGKSPWALSITVAALRSADQLQNLPAALAQEYRLALRALRSPDFAEGVRAQVIDKDRSPHWSPSSLAEVDPAAVRAAFAPLTADERDAFATTEWEQS